MILKICVISLKGLEFNELSICHKFKVSEARIKKIALAFYDRFGINYSSLGFKKEELLIIFLIKQFLCIFFRLCAFSVFLRSDKGQTEICNR